MRWIRCDVCNDPANHHGVSRVFRTLVVCHVCRMSVINYWKDILELPLDNRKPFIREFMNLESESTYQGRIRGFKRDDSNLPVDNSLDLLDLM